MDNLNRQVSLREYEPPSGMGPSEKGVITAELIHRFVTFRVHGQTYGLPLESVERAVRMAAVTAVPDGVAGLYGVINIEGHLAAVLDVRRIFGLPARAPSLSDRLVIMSIMGRRICLVADEVCDVLDLTIDQTPDLPLARSPFMVGTVHHAGKVIFLLDPARLLASPEYSRLPQSQGDAKL